MIRIGLGYDVHKLVKNRPLILGGVEIDHYFGLLGHSDADVLIHAIMDSILGAMALGDIGKFFPDSDNKYKNISSLILLSKIFEIMDKNSYKIGNLDTIIIAQKPKLSNYIDEMRNNISKSLKTGIQNISIKATTEEGLGFTGIESGIAAWASVIINKI